MVTYKIMPNNFPKSTCNQTKVVLKHGDTIFYVKSSDELNIKDHRAYSPNSQVADWLKQYGTLIPHEVKPAKVALAQTVPVMAPVMASMLHDTDHPVKLAPKSDKIMATVRPTANGKWVWIPN